MKDYYNKTSSCSDRLLAWVCLFWTATVTIPLSPGDSAGPASRELTPVVHSVLALS